MLVALYVTSMEKGSGKTAICAGLGKRFLNERKKVGYLKPIVTEGEKTGTQGSDRDTVFLKQLLSLDEPLDILCPVISNRSNVVDSIKEAYAKASSGKDIVFIEGPSEQYLTSGDIVTALNARVLIVEPYSQDLKKISSYSGFKQSLLGVVINKVPKSRMEQTRREMSAQLDESKVNILGVLPEDRALLTLTIGELVEHIQGEILRGEEQSSELIENLMLGAMTVDTGTDYFSRKANKVVVVKSERPDMQLAALQTSTRCLVLTGDTEPRSVVLDKAEAKNIPIVLTRNSTSNVVKNIEDALEESRFNQEKKLSRLEKIIEQNFDFQTLYRELGLTG
jgi:BioD-like phosphotransacetylase family protein